MNDEAYKEFCITRVEDLKKIIEEFVKCLVCYEEPRKKPAENEYPRKSVRKGIQRKILRSLAGLNKSTAIKVAAKIR